MFGTMQSNAERIEAACLYPEWGSRLNELEKEAIRLHGYGWGDQFPKNMNKKSNLDLFQPMCKDCI